jgi:hypothetical protein
MSSIACKECQSLVGDLAVTCPKCGAAMPAAQLGQPSKSHLMLVRMLLIAALLGAALVALFVIDR